MTTAIFFRLLSSDDKAAALAQALDALNAGRDLPGVLHSADPASFSQLPGAPFPYWVSDAMREMFSRLPRLEGNGAEARLGPHGGEDTRYVRAWWEVPPGAIGRRIRWVSYAKGGEYARYHYDIHLLVDWDDKRRTFRGFQGRPGRPNILPENVDYFFRPGSTYPRRSQCGFSARAMPAGCVFADKGPSIFVVAPLDDAYLLGFLNSSVARILLSMQMAFGSYEVGAVQKIPFAAPPRDLRSQVGELARQCHDLKRDDDRGDETTHAFTAPALLLGSGATLTARMDAALSRSGERAAAIATHSYAIDRLVLDLYAVSPEDRAAIDEELKPHPGSYPDETARLDEARFRQAYLTKEEVANEDDGDDAEGAATENGAARGKKRRARYRDWDELAHLFRAHPAAIARRRAELGLLRPDELAAETESLLSYCLGVAFGRWDARIGQNPELATALGGAFDALPICAPGALTDDAALLRAEPLPYRPARLPAGPGDLPAEYPVDVQWSGLLADDPEHPADDLLRRLREVLAYLFGESAEAIEQEACSILGVKDLRDYLRRPAAFFAAHLARYSRSRRQAPIYWPLSTASGSYTLWLYYPRLTSDTLYTAVNRYLEPRIAAVTRRVDELAETLRGVSGREATRLREEMEAARAFLAELVELRDELLRVAALPYRPDLNDGVIINAAPLHRLFRLPRWAKDTRATWEKLERGEYDWAHLAYAIWPERVRAKCRSDRSLAIAHGLEEL